MSQLNQIPCIYVLHSGQLYGTERMAMVTVRGISSDMKSILLAPPGPILAEAEYRGIATQCFQHNWDLVRYLKSYLVHDRQLVFITTGVFQSILIIVGNLFYRRQIVHLHIVHGGTDERLSYARKSLLNYFPVKLVAVSEFVRDRLQAHGVRPQQIETIENFLSTAQIETVPKRQPFTKSGINRIIIVSRLDPIKRVDLLFDALDFCSRLDRLEFRILGLGRDMERLKKRATEYHPQVTLEGFSDRVLETMANSDLLLHLCPVEPFGLVILEAMAVGIPVLVPDRGGTGIIVEHGISGFQFRANDKNDLAFWLIKLQQASPQLLNSVVSNARKTLKSRFSEQRGIAAYRYLFNKGNSVRVKS